MLNCSLRDAKISNQIQSQAEKHGDDDVTALRIPFYGVMLSSDELCLLLQEPLAWRALFVEKAGEPAQPLFNQKLKPFALKEKFVGARVRIVHSIDNEELVLTACKLTKIKLEPQIGGLTEVSFTVNACPSLDERVAHLLSRLNKDVNIEITGAEIPAENRQQDLPLNTFGDGEQKNDDAEDEDFSDQELPTVEDIEKARAEAK